MKILFCEHNKGSGKVYRRLRTTYPDLDIKMKDCIKRCGPCHTNPFVTVNEKSLCGIDADDLYTKVVRELGL